MNTAVIRAAMIYIKVNKGCYPMNLAQSICKFAFQSVAHFSHV